MSSSESSKNKLTASQARSARRERRQNRNKFRRWLIGLAVALIAGLLILSLILPMFDSIGSSNDDTPDGPGIKMESQGNTHINEGADHPPYNSMPATSGWHYAQPLAPVKWGVHDEFISEEKRLHNLEHGGISITYDPDRASEELINSLKEILKNAGAENFSEILLSPYPGTRNVINMTSWMFIDSFDAFDKNRINEFIRSHHNSATAPERFAN